MFQKIGMIGAGHMGSAIIKKINDTFNGPVLLSEPDQKRLQKALAFLKNGAPSDNETIARECDLIILAVKPQVLPDVFKSLRPVLDKRNDFTLLSMAAGVEMKSYSPYPIIRIMPNTPVEIGEGVIAYAVNNVAEETENSFREILQTSGTVVRLPEEQIDAVCVLSGCGPAFVYMFIKALAEKGEKLGLSKDVALKLAVKTCIGSGKMITETGIDPDTLKDQVCSPGGATIEGVRSLEKNRLEEIVGEALQASFDRTLELK